MNKRTLVIIFSLCLLPALLLSGCKPAEVEDDADDLRLSNAWIVQLAGNATTGYSWVATEFDAEKLNVVELPYVQDENKPGMAGVGGTYRFYIQPKDGETGGEYDVTFSYVQNWDGGNKDGGTAVVHITVNGEGIASGSEPIVTRP